MHASPFLASRLERAWRRFDDRPPTETLRSIAAEFDVDFAEAVIIEIGCAGRLGQYRSHLRQLLTLRIQAAQLRREAC